MAHNIKNPALSAGRGGNCVAQKARIKKEEQARSFGEVSLFLSERTSDLSASLQSVLESSTRSLSMSGL